MRTTQKKLFRFVEAPRHDMPVGDEHAVLWRHEDGRDGLLVCQAHTKRFFECVECSDDQEYVGKKFSLESSGRGLPVYSFPDDKLPSMFRPCQQNGNLLRFQKTHRMIACYAIPPGTDLPEDFKVCEDGHLCKSNRIMARHSICYVGKAPLMSPRSNLLLTGQEERIPRLAFEIPELQRVFTAAPTFYGLRCYAPQASNTDYHQLVEFLYGIVCEADVDTAIETTTIIQMLAGQESASTPPQLARLDTHVRAACVRLLRRWFVHAEFIDDAMEASMFIEKLGCAQSE